MDSVIPEYQAMVSVARAALLALNVAEREYLQSMPYRLDHEFDMRAGRYLVRARLTQPMPDDVHRLVGDIVGDLVAALNAIASALAGAPVRFPIHDSLPMFAQRARKVLSRMPDEAQAAIEALQPYHAIGGYRNGALWLLQEFATHAPRLAAGVIRPGATMGVNTCRKVSLLGEPLVSDGAFDEGDIVGSGATRIVGPDPKLDMFMRADFALGFAAKGPAGGGEVRDVLVGLCDHVEGVVIAALAPWVAGE